jgi:hypothetical protein
LGHEQVVIGQHQAPAGNIWQRLTHRKSHAFSPCKGDASVPKPMLRRPASRDRDPVVSSQQANYTA